MKGEECLENNIYNFSTGFSASEEIVTISEILRENLGRVIKVRVSVPKGCPDEVVSGRVRELIDMSGVQVLVITDAVSEENNNICKEMYKISLQVICMVEVFSEEALPIKKAAN